MITSVDGRKVAVFDFDGTIASKYDADGRRIHYPAIGRPVPLARECLELYGRLGFYRVIVTARSNCPS